VVKVTLIFPNYVIREQFGEPSDPPIGIASIAAVLEAKGYDVSVIDANAENLALDEICLRLAQIKPDIVGVSCNYSPLHNPTLQIAAMIKSELGVPVIVGGNHATAMARHMLGCSRDIDFIVRGEGEVILPDLVEALQHGSRLSYVKGISYRDANSIVTTPDAPLISNLDKLPMPAYHLLPMDKYSRYNIMASRGCPFSCSYCASNVIFKRKVRYRSPGSVVDEVRYLMQTYGNRHLWFSDDTFISNPKYTSALLDKLIESDLDITWSCLTRVDIVNKELLEKMKISKCSYISYGIESGNQEMLDKMGKGITANEVLTTLRLTAEVGIRQYGFFLVGLPGESWETIMDSYKLIYQSKLDGAAFNIVIPLPGTRLMNDLLEADLVKLDDINWDYLFARTPQETYESYPAELAARWTKISGAELVDACKIGHRFPQISRHILGNSR